MVAKDSVDIVTCNPPYFKVSSQSITNPNDHLALARHELTTDFATVARVASADLLKYQGKAFYVHRPERLAELLTTLTVVGLAPKRLQFIHPREDREANMVLIEAIKAGRPNGDSNYATIDRSRSGWHILVIGEEVAEWRLKRITFTCCYAQMAVFMAASPMMSQRVATHNAGKGAKYTAQRLPVRLLYHEAFADKHDALSAEWHFKHQTRHRKEVFWKIIRLIGDKQD